MVGKELTIKICINVSADCTVVNSELNIEVTSKLPIHHGATVDYHCSRNHDKKGHVDATCQDGTISFLGQPSPCVKIGRKHCNFCKFNASLKCKNCFFLRAKLKQFLHFNTIEFL